MITFLGVCPWIGLIAYLVATGVQDWRVHRRLRRQRVEHLAMLAVFGELDQDERP